MRRRVILSDEARDEVESAVAWYNAQKPALGAQFEEEIANTIKRILARPERFPLRSKSIRAASVETFDKYKVLFRLEPDFIGIVAVFHSSRNPEVLRRRLK